MIVIKYICIKNESNYVCQAKWIECGSFKNQILCDVMYVTVNKDAFHFQISPRGKAYMVIRAAFVYKMNEQKILE